MSAEDMYVLGSDVRYVDGYVKLAMEDAGVPACHSWPHVERVYHHANTICVQEGVDWLESGCTSVAALLHDLGRIPEAADVGHTQRMTNHAKTSAVMAEELFKARGSIFAASWLREAASDPAIISLIVRAIAQHSQFEPAESRVGQMLQDADKLDALGWVGFCRQVEYKTGIEAPLIKRMMIEGGAPAELRGEIERLIANLRLTVEWFPEMFNTDSGREIALSPWAENVGYLNRLEKLVG